MNKAIYIFDEPASCVACQFKEYVEEPTEDDSFAGGYVCGIKQVWLDFDNSVSRPSWCPLMIFRGSTAGVRKMTLIEALHDIQRLKIHSAKTAVDAIKKAIPQEFKNDSKPGTYMCPKCETSVKKTDLYCRHCGQALKERKKSYE